MELMDIIKGRRAIRDFSDKEISQDILNKILEAGLWAPSGSNIQGWEIYLITKIETIKKIKLLSPGVFGFPKALVILCINTEKAKKGGNIGEKMALMDLSMAAQNIMLMAYSLGIGSCPAVSFNKSGIKVLLDMPEYLDPALMISLGYPTTIPPPPKRRSLEEVVHYE